MPTEEAKQEIERKIAKYQSLSKNERKGYNEANTVNSFVRPLFEALGWDFSDINQVEAEKTIVKGRVDFLFKIDRVSCFCLEVKSLRDDLTDENREQAVSYAYNKGVTWAVLTNFDRLQVLNAERQTANVNDVIFLNLSCEDYLSDFGDLDLLSRELFPSGALDRKAVKYGKLARRVPVEKRLYEHLQKSREQLFNEVYKFHKDMAITLEDTDRLIQELFSRLLFIRTAEDRNLAGNHPLEAVLHQCQQDTGREFIEDLRGIFRDFADVYDSNLFPTMDPWEQIWVSGGLLEYLIEGLYNVPGDFARYQFDRMDADVLGQIYEQYLGYIAQVAKEEVKKQQLRLLPPEEVYEIAAKKEKRKGAGIYYTPKWVTDYIVRQTVGRFIDEHTHDEILNMKILDPACGSGSFLIRAYDELLSYHARIRGKNVADLNWTERIAILTRNIFGVDLDPQAVEIARLNLLLRALAEREALPPLANNIQCGNSLITGSDEELQRWFGDDFKTKKPFNWVDKFPEIMKNGGFNVVIGNPPYVNEARGNKELFRELKKVPKLQFYYEKNMDLFNYFIEIGLDLLKEGGYLGQIIPAYWQNRSGARLLRQKITSESNIERFVDFGDFRVFQESLGHHSSIIILKKTVPSKLTSKLRYLKIAFDETTSYDEQLSAVMQMMQSDEMFPCTYEMSVNKLIVQGSGPNILAVFKRKPYFHFSKDQVVRGVDTSPSDYRGVGVFVMSQDEVDKIHDSLTPQEKEILKPFYHAHQVDRYYYDPQNYNWLIYTDKERRHLLEKSKEDYPTLVGHLDLFRDIITSDNKPYGLHRPKKESNFVASNKILFVRKTPYPKFVLVPIPYFFDEAMYLILYDETDNPCFLTGILNSSLAKYWFATHKKQGDQLQVDKEIILSFPIRRIDFDNPEEKKMHDDLMKLVDKMLDLNKNLPTIPSTHVDKRDEIMREIERTDRKIDNLVYDLYGLTQEEREIVEEQT